MSEENLNQEQQGENTEGNQEDFKPINSQAELDERLKDRIERIENRARRQVESEYADALEKAKKFDELEEANKTELQKLTERAENAESELKTLRDAAQRSEWRAAAAKETGISAELIKGDTQEEMLEHAKSIAAFVGEKPKYQNVPNGGKPSSATDSTDIEDQLREAAGLKKKG